MLLLPGAHAAGDVTAKPAVLQQAWFWENAYEQAQPPVAEPAPATEPSGVPDGDLAVAYTGNSDKSSSKVAVLSFDVSAVPAHSSVGAFSFSLTLDGAPTATTFGAPAAAVIACLPTRAWPAEMPGDYTGAPSVDCGRKATPQVSGSTYTFTIPAIAQTWVDDQNLGVAILADPDAVTAPFQLVFSGAKSVSAQMTYTPPAETGGATSGPTGSGGSAVPPPVTTGTTGGGAFAAPPQSGVGDVLAAPPVVAPSTAPVAPATRPVAVSKTASSLPPKAFWAACLLLAAILLGASLVLGDPAPVAATAAPSRLDRVLRERSLTLGDGEAVTSSSL
jgi:hypothetical protein